MMMNRWMTDSWIDEKKILLERLNAWLTPHRHTSHQPNPWDVFLNIKLSQFKSIRILFK